MKDSPASKVQSLRRLQWWKGAFALPLLAGCAAGSAGQSEAPASGLTVRVEKARSVITIIVGDGDATATAAPEAKTEGQSVTGPKVDAKVEGIPK